MTAYETLLLDYRPRPIRTEATYKRMLKQVERLMTKPSLNQAESEMVELLSTLVEQYESVRYPTPKTSPAETLAHLIEARGVTRSQLARESGIPLTVITNVLAGRRAISKANAVRLADYFNASLRLFIEQ